MTAIELAKLITAADILRANGFDFAADLVLHIATYGDMPEES